MDARDLFLDQHAVAHTAAVGGNTMSAAERTLGGLTDEQMRVRPREDLNSIAWLVWHIARAEDILVNRVIAGRPQVFDDAWMKRLAIDRKDFGIGMTSAEVSDLTGRIDIGALREYRDAVGLRTRENVSAFKAQDWEGVTTAERLQQAAADGGFGSRVDRMVQAFTGRPRAAVLSGIALFHSIGHLGEAVTVRGAGGFGTGV
ncbi:MAG: DinB family protein [Candidatus Rokuibacteriota bacterium]